MCRPIALHVWSMSFTATVKRGVVTRTHPRIACVEVVKRGWQRREILGFCRGTPALQGGGLLLLRYLLLIVVSVFVFGAWITNQGHCSNRTVASKEVGALIPNMLPRALPLQFGGEPLKTEGSMRCRRHWLLVGATIGRNLLYLSSASASFPSNSLLIQNFASLPDIRRSKKCKQYHHGSRRQKLGKRIILYQHSSQPCVPQALGRYTECIIGSLFPTV
jgi:hypothetical protein